MRKLKIFVLFLIATVPALQAQLLWKISGKGLKSPSYLFGTHHLIPISFLDSVPRLYKAFNSSDMVVGEMVLNNIDATAKLQKAAIMPNHINMTDLLSADDYQLVDNELKSVLKFGLKEVGLMNPTLILSLYEIAIYKKVTGLSDDMQSDSYFQLVANEKDKKVEGLETIDQQIEVLFGNGSLERQAEILIKTIRNKDSILLEISHLNKLYKEGRINELVAYSKQKDNVVDLTEDEYNKLVDKRNEEWMNKLPNLFSKNSCFVAVGALHLGGNNGLIELLKRKGYKVKEIKK